MSAAEAYLAAIAREMKNEYLAIHQAGLILQNGVIESTSNFVEHPEMVARRHRLGAAVGEEGRVRAFACSAGSRGAHFIRVIFPAILSGYNFPARSQTGVSDRAQRARDRLPRGWWRRHARSAASTLRERTAMWLLPNSAILWSTAVSARRQTRERHYA
jgi:hypothetical protein